MTASRLPIPNANGVVNLTYTISNGSGMLVSRGLRIDIAPQPDAPVAGNDTLAMVEDQVWIVDPALLLAVMDFVTDQDKLDISGGAVASYSQPTITARQTTAANGTVHNEILGAFGRGSVLLDGVTAADRASLTATSFVFNPPAAAMRMAQPAATVPEATDQPTAKTAAGPKAQAASARISRLRLRWRWHPRWPVTTA